MQVVFPVTGFPRECHGEVDDVLHRIAVGDGPGRWSSLPDEIRILRRLGGGRSNCEVLEVDVIRGGQQSTKVIKLGPIHELKNEFNAFAKHLQNPSAFFLRIEAVTLGLLKESQSRGGERQAVVYDHAARFIGKPKSPTRNFEDVARKAVRCGGAALDSAISALLKLFEGVQNDLYDKCKLVSKDSPPEDLTLRKAWNRRLGIDAVVKVDRCIKSRERRLETSMPSAHRVKRNTLWPRDVASASAGLDNKAAPGDLVQLNNARIAWWEDRLMAEVDAHHLRIELEADGNQTIRQLAAAVAEGSTWTVCGRLDRLRLTAHRDHRLLRGLSELKLADGVLAGPEARVPDPFAVLANVLDSRRAHRVTALVHGDLNPRNILLVEGSPCLIDYAFTCDAEPIFMDFARLEGCLTRVVLPPDFSWSQQVRLQRLLAVASRLGDEAAHCFAERLASDREELGAAFRLLWTIRRAAREAYPASRREHWAREFLEQLFLFAHLTLKWDEQTPSALRATAAMSGVAAEALSGNAVFRLWEPDDIRDDGAVILQFMRRQPVTMLPELASLAERISGFRLKADDPLWSQFEAVRAEFVRQTFHDAANDTARELEADHKVYINLKAYIDLKGQLKPGQRRHQGRSWTSEEDILQDDELLAEREQLLVGIDGDDNVLKLIAANSAVLVIGDAGSGKSTVVREWEYRLALAIVDDGADGSRGSESPAAIGKKAALRVEPQMPIVLRAPDIPERLKKWKADDLESTVSVLGQHPDLLVTGSVCVIIDALNELDNEQRQQIADWIIDLHESFPLTAVIVCHRQYNYLPGLLPFPVVTLQKVEAAQARRYIHDYLRETGVADHEQLSDRLVKLLLESPDHRQVRDLAQTPLFLWMIVERYRQNQILPESRGGLFEDFSRWYLEELHHTKHDEAVSALYSYEQKAVLLGAIGYELVQRRATDLPECAVERLVPDSVRGCWENLLAEIVAAEWLHRDDGKLRFLHQSFQEYFAARHFLEHEAVGPAAIRHKVLQLGWHESFALLLGFGGDKPEVVNQIIEAALQVNPVLTARCLRMAELPDSKLLKQFVEVQDAVLRDANVGEFSQQRAAQALAEYGGELARSALWRMATDSSAPQASRVESLRRLATMPGQARFELVVQEMYEPPPGRSNCSS